MPLGMPAGNDLETLIRRAAIAKGFSPDVAVARAKAQGLQDESQIASLFPSNDLPQQEAYDRGPGPGQMHEQPSYGGGGGARSSGGGLLSGMFGEGNPVSQAVSGVQGLLGGISNDNATGFLDYGGVPFGTRMSAVSEAIGAGRSGRSMNPDIMGMVPAAKEANRIRGMANSLADSLEATNPVLAQAIRANPALVRDYMKGQIDLDQAKQSADYEHDLRTEEADTAYERSVTDDERKRGWAVEDRDYATANTPEAKWTGKWNKFIDESDLGMASTTEVYRRWTGDNTLTDTEAQRMANANSTEKSLNDEYDQIKDDRGKERADTLSAQSGGLEKGEYLLNPEEVARGLPPKVGTMEGSKREQEMKAAQDVEQNIENYKIKTGQDVTRAANEALGSIDRSERGLSLPSTGWWAAMQWLPETEARNLSNSLHTMRSNLALDKVIEVRQATKTGAGIGPPSDFEQKMLMSAGTTLDQYESSQDIKSDIKYAARRYEAITTFTQGADGKYRSVIENDAMMLRSNPNEKAMAAFNKIYGQGAAEIALGTGDATTP